MSILAPSNFNCKDPVGFSWWLVSQVAPLYWYNERGVFSLRKKVFFNGVCLGGENVTIIVTLKWHPLSTNQKARKHTLSNHRLKLEH